ncbi:MAG: acetate--CoA ligase family protein [Nitrososphaerales archaeon]
MLGSEAYEIISDLGIQIAPYQIAQSVEEAAKSCDSLGYPVVLKIVSPDIIHKSEVGAVITGVKTQEEMRTAYAQLVESFSKLAPDAKVSGVMVQSQVKGVEIIVGAKRDKTFGPIVMIGLGGIWVELLHDVAIGLCPITSSKALDMIRGIRGFKLLDGFRGAERADLEPIIEAMLAMSSVMESIPEISEIEINPLIVGSGGKKSYAADARVTLQGAKATNLHAEVREPKLSGESFRHLFEAESIAVVGGSTDYSKVGGRIVSRIKNHGYEGKLVVVNPKEAAASSSGSIPAFPSIASVPFEIDAALIVIPAENSVDVVRECARKGVKFVAVYASGFGEKDATGEERQNRLANAIEGSTIGNMRLVGPNILGLICPSTKLYAEFTSYQGEMKPGNVGFVTQSGGIGSSLVTESVDRGLDISALISTGNEADLDVADAIDYYVKDPETKVIVCYIENISDGQKLKLAATEAFRAGKPIIVFKSGTSDFGQSLAKSHTGAIAVDDRIFDAFAREYGITRVDSLYDTIEFAKGFAMQPLPNSNRLGIVSGSGGANVIMTDVLSNKNVAIPEFSGEMQNKLHSLFPDTVVRNPVDYSAAVVSAPKLIGEVVDAILKDGRVDALIIVVTTFAEMQGKIISEDIVRCKKYGKPILVVWPFPRSAVGRHIEYLQKENSVPVYLSVEDAAKSIAAMMHYSNFLSSPPKK